jgi:hypothetical protein
VRDRISGVVPSQVSPRIDRVIAYHRWSLTQGVDALRNRQLVIKASRCITRVLGRIYYGDIKWNLI